jgi:hypothetical protein
VRTSAIVCLGCALAAGSTAFSQEADSGLDVRAVVSGQLSGSTKATEPPRSGSPFNAGYRSLLYPTMKLGEHWSVSAALETYSSRYFYEDFSEDENRVETRTQQASIDYARVSDKGSLLIRGGELQTVFGDFPLRYDDNANALIDLPLQYGYYDRPVSTAAAPAVQVDLTRAKWDGRFQLAHSSPASYGYGTTHDGLKDWSGGIGYTARQGLRFGFSAYGTPGHEDAYSDDGGDQVTDESMYSAHAVGADVEWSRGHTELRGEWQMFLLRDQDRELYRDQAGYLELKRVLNPRWYVGGRAGFLTSEDLGGAQSYEGAAGFRLSRFQVVKAGYELQHNEAGLFPYEHTFTLQVVTSLHLLSLSRGN